MGGGPPSSLKPPFCDRNLPKKPIKGDLCAQREARTPLSLRGNLFTFHYIYELKVNGQYKSCVPVPLFADQCISIKLIPPHVIVWHCSYTLYVIPVSSPISVVFHKILTESKKHLPFQLTITHPVIQVVGETKSSRCVFISFHCPSKHYDSFSPHKKMF